MIKPFECIVIASGIFCLLAAFLLIMSLNPAVGKEIVVASSYGDPQDIRRTGERKTATGSPLDPNGNTVAHKTLKLGSKLTLTHGRYKVVVTVADRGPFVKGRTLDLTPAVNKALHCYGLCKVRMESWPPLPRSKPEFLLADAKIQWGEE